MTPQQRNKDIQRVIDWARTNAGKTEGALLLEGLEKEWQPGKVHWSWLKERFTRLIELKEVGAVPTMRRHLEDPKTTTEEICFILKYARQLDAKSFKEKAEQLCMHADLGVQQQAALLLHATGERKKSYEAFARVLEKERVAWASELPTTDVLNALVKDGTPEARKVIERITVNP
jgi:hypothetical protein